MPRRLTLLSIFLLLAAIAAMPSESRGEGGGNVCHVNFSPISQTQVKACYEGFAAGEPVSHCIVITNRLNPSVIAEMLRDGRDCADVIITGA